MEEDRSVLLGLTADLAAVRIALVARRWGVEPKYRPDQSRIAAGNGRQSGQFADEGRNRVRAAGDKVLKAGAGRAAAALAANPETAALLAVGAVPSAIGGIGISRAAGLTSVLASGGAGRAGGEGMTPILGLPVSLDVTATSDRANRDAQQRGRVEEECEKQFDQDKFRCEVDSAMYSRSAGMTRNQAMAVCMRQAMTRYGECKAGGGPDAISSPLFSPRKTSGRRRKK